MQKHRKFDKYSFRVNNYDENNKITQLTFGTIPKFTQFAFPVIESWFLNADKFGKRLITNTKQIHLIRLS